MGYYDNVFFNFNDNSMIKDHLYTINIYDKERGKIIFTRHTFDLQQARRWKKEVEFSEIINQIGNEIK